MKPNPEWAKDFPPLIPSPQITPTEIGALVRTQRNAVMMTQHDLAHIARVGTRFVVELESGKPTAHIGKLLDVLHVLGIVVRLVSCPADPGFELPDEKRSLHPRRRGRARASSAVEHPGKHPFDNDEAVQNCIAQLSDAQINELLGYPPCPDAPA